MSSVLYLTERDLNEAIALVKKLAENKETLPYSEIVSFLEAKGYDKERTQYQVIIMSACLEPTPSSKSMRVEARVYQKKT